MIKNSFHRVICLLMIAFLLSSFPAGSSALALCLDEEENHLVDQNLYLVDSHSSEEANLLFSDEHCSVLAKQENNDCVDVSLTNANTLNLPTKLFLPVSAKVILSYELPDNLTVFQQHLAGNTSSALTHPLLTASLLKAHRTVVLLI